VCYNECAHDVVDLPDGPQGLCATVHLGGFLLESTLTIKI